MVGLQQRPEVDPSFVGDLIVLPQPPVGGGFLFGLGQITRLGDPVDGRIGEDDGEDPVATGFQEIRQFADVVLLLGKEKEDQQLGQGFFQVVLQAVGPAALLLCVFVLHWCFRLFCRVHRNLFLTISRRKHGCNCFSKNKIFD